MSLKTAFDHYLELLSRSKVSRAEKETGLALFQSRVHQIRAMAERSERTPRFTRLVKETKARYAKRPDREQDDSWRLFVKHVLRRARIYADALDGGHSVEELFQNFVAAFTPSETIAKIMAPLEYVEFSADASLNFGSFCISKFPEQQLSTIVENDTRKIFYPDSTLNNMHLLSQYWWLVANEKSQPCYAGQHLVLTGDEFQKEPVRRHYGHFPQAVRNVLQTLVLYDWDGNSCADPGDVGRYLLDNQEGRWFGFNLPFFLRSGGSLFRPPSQAPDISCLALDPFFDRDGVELGECPERSISLNATETCSFSRAVTEFETQLNTVRSQTERWQFIDVAVGYLVKAFFSDELDQLLWHIVAIEALLGQDTKGTLTETLGRRCGLVLGSSRKDSTKIGKSFKELYEFRSDVVHGNSKLIRAHGGHLAIARYIARDVAVWFLRYLCFLAKDLPTDDERCSKRDELLSALEMREDERERLSYLIGRVPCGFPGKWS